MKKYSLTILGCAGFIVAALSLTGCSTIPEKILASFDGDTLRVPAYEEMFLRTRSTPPATDKEKRDFLDILVDYRIKLREAQELGLGEDPAFQAEMKQYRDQLAVSFLFDRDLVEPGMKTLFDRRLEEIQPQHIFVRIERDETGAIDTMTAFIKARDILEKAKRGQAFDSLALEFSDDESVKFNSGVIGWFIAGTTFPMLDDMLYGSKVGEVAPQLLRTGTGYHVLRLHGRAPSHLRLRPAHILYRLDLENPLDTAAGYAQLSLVLDSLKRGLATFEDLARRNSMDSLSGAAGGDLGWMNRGTNIEPRFEDALFNMRVGEVSPVVRSAFGMHIIKVLDEEPPLPYEQQKDMLRGIYRQERFPVDVLFFLERLRKEYGFEFKENVASRVLARVAPGATTSTPDWDRKLTKDILEGYLFQLKTGPVTVREVVDFSKHEQSLQMRTITWGLLDTLAISYADNLITIDKSKNFEKEFPEFNRLVREFRESSLIAKVEDQEVVSKINPDEQDVKAFWQQNRDMFMMPDRVHVQEIYTYDKVRAAQLLDSLAAGLSFEYLAGLYTQRMGYAQKNGDWGLMPLNQNELSQAAAKLQPGEYTGPMNFQSGFSIVRCASKEAERQMTYEEARPAVQTRLKSILRDTMVKQWVETLRLKYSAVLYPDNLEHTFPGSASGKTP